MTPFTAADRVRSFLHVIIAGSYFFVAQSLSARAANGLGTGVWVPLIDRGSLLFLLVVGFAVMGRLFNRQQAPIQSMGLARRSGWQREFGLGAGLGWGMLVVCILPLVLSGGLIITFGTLPKALGDLLIDVAALAVASLAEEVAFRGYPFQRMIDCIGPTLATVLFSLFFAGLHMFNPYANWSSFWVTAFSGWLLSVAYLRTRALWVGWGWHFAWNASMALLFGLPLSGITRFSPVIQSDTVGPLWMTGGDYGPEASGVTVVVMLIGVALMFRLTRTYAYLYNQPVIVAAGIPVDLDAMSSVLAPHHQEPAIPPAGATLVQISGAPKPAPIAAPATAPAPSPTPAPNSFVSSAPANLTQAEMPEEAPEERPE